MKTESKDHQTRLRREFEADLLAERTIELADACKPGRVEETAAKIRDLQRQAAELAPWKYGENLGE